MVKTAQQLKEEGVEIFTIGVGLVDRSQLQLIASSREDSGLGLTRWAHTPQGQPLLGTSVPPGFT